jgi:hypothetical protein
VPPLPAARAASRGVPRRFGDSDPRDLGRSWVPSTPCGVSTPCGGSSIGPSRRPKPGEAPLALSRPFRDVSPRPRDAGSGGRPGPTTRPRGHRCLSWASLPYGTSRFGGPASLAADPSAAACHVRGLATSIAASTTEPAGARGAGAPVGFPLQGVLLGREPYPSRGPFPLDVAAPAPPPLRGTRGAAAYRALLPRRARSVTGAPKRPGRRCLPGVHPSRAFPPCVRATACSRGAGPIALGRVDVPTRLDLRASRSVWIGLVRFRTAGSPGVSHLTTVAALRTPGRGAGSWIHLPRDIA